MAKTFRELDVGDVFFVVFDSGSINIKQITEIYSKSKFTKAFNYVNLVYKTSHTEYAFPNNDNKVHSLNSCILTTDLTIAKEYLSKLKVDISTALDYLFEYEQNFSRS